MQIILPCFCMTFPEIHTSQPCDDYPQNAIYSWDASCECPKCHATATAGRRFKTKGEAVFFAIEVWNDLVK